MSGFQQHSLIKPMVKIRQGVGQARNKLFALGFGKLIFSTVSRLIDKTNVIDIVQRKKIPGRTRTDPDRALGP